MGGSTGAPQPDKRMGEAAMLSAQTGQDALSWMKEQATISNAWAQEDRERWETIYKPIEEEFVQDSVNYDSAARRAAAADAAQSDVQQGFQSSQGQMERQNAALGVRPDSGRGAESTRRSATDLGLASAGARNTARRQVESDGYMRKANAVNLGKGYQVNPGTSLGMATSTGASGYQAAMSGYGQQANILGQEHNQQMQAWQADQQSSAGLWGGLGTLAGYGLQSGMFAALSSEKAKTNNEPVKDALGAVRKMRVEEWDYKDGMGDGGRHIGPYAEEFAEATGVGDGKTINLIDSVGVALGAIKDLDAKVDKLAVAA